MSELTIAGSGAGCVEGLLIDLDGVVYVGDAPLPGSREAIERIRAAGMPFKFVTNTTRRPLRCVVEHLSRMGLTVAAEEIYTPAALARSFLARNNLAPFLVTHPNLREDFADLPPGSEEAVVVGDAGEFFTYELLNRAYRKIVSGAVFLALAKNRCFLDGDGELSLDAGPFVQGLEFASGRDALVLGKPSATFFHLAVAGLGCPAENVAMIGDDAEADVGGAVAAGLMGILVQTGKYRPGQEARLPQRPVWVADDLEAGRRSRAKCKEGRAGDPGLAVARRGCRASRRKIPADQDLVWRANGRSSGSHKPALRPGHIGEAHRAYGVMRGRGWTFADALRFAWGRARETRDLRQRELAAFHKLQWAA